MQMACVCECTRDCVCAPCLSAILFTHHYFQAVILYMAEGKEEQFFASREYAEARVSLHECVRINTRELNHTIPLCPSLFPEHHKVHMQVTRSYRLKVKHKQFELGWLEYSQIFLSLLSLS